MNRFEMNALFLCVLWIVSAAQDDCAGKFIHPADREHGICQPCTDCAEMDVNKFVGKPCGPSADTVCCPRPNMTVEGNECHERDNLTTISYSTMEPREMTTSKTTQDEKKPNNKISQNQISQIEISQNVAQATRLNILTFVFCYFFQVLFYIIIN